MQNKLSAATIKAFVIGDVVGRVGRRTVEFFLKRIRQEINPDILLINGENAAGGFGITEKIYQQFTEELGVDCITMGNHWHDKKEIHNFLERAPRLVLPANMGNVAKEQLGLRILKTSKGQSFAVINLIGQAFMHDTNRNPFQTVERLLAAIPDSVCLRFVDMHGEATSEKQGMGVLLDGRVSLVYGTHSHVQTADERLLKQGTGFITDVGATGAYDSIIGMDKKLVLKRLLSGEKAKLCPARDDPWLCAVEALIDEKTGRCRQLIRHRWHLNEFV